MSADNFLLCTNNKCIYPAGKLISAKYPAQHISASLDKKRLENLGTHVLLLNDYVVPLPDNKKDNDDIIIESFEPTIYPEDKHHALIENVMVKKEKKGSKKRRSNPKKRKTSVKK